MRKLFSIILVLCVCLMPISAFATDYTDKTVIIYTGNLRGDVDKLPLIAAARAGYEDEGANVILVDVGSFLQGSQYTTKDGGKTFISLMAQTGYSAAVPGRYDFAFGTGQLGTTSHSEDPDITYNGSIGSFFDTASPYYSADTMKLTSANISGSNDYFYGISANETLTVGDITIGIFGLTDTAVPGYTLETNLSGVNFGSPSATAASQAAELSDCDVIIGLSNAGALTVDGVEIINVTSGGDFTIGALVIDDENNISREDVTLENTDNDILTAVEEWKVQVSYDVVLKSEVTLNGSMTDNRRGGTNTGDLWTDAMRWYATTGKITFDSDYAYDGIMVEDDNVVAIWNGGNLRDYLNDGEVTTTDIYRVLPYPNTLALVYLKGSELLEQLEACSQGLPYSANTISACASFMHASGMKYSVNTSYEYNAGEFYRAFSSSTPTVGWHKVDAEKKGRVTITEVNGKAFNPESIYCVVTSNANYNGMDASYILGNPQNDPDHWSINIGSSSKSIRDIVLEYIEDELGGVIDSSYAASQNRITVGNLGIISDPEPTPTMPPVNRPSGGSGNGVITAPSVTAPIAPVSQSWNNPYSDIGADMWYYDSIKYVTENNLMNGMGEDEFEPNTSMTRGMFVTMLYRLSGTPEVYGENPFEDVAQEDYYYNAVLWAVQKEITYGVSDTTFEPKKTMSRQEMAAFIYRYYSSAAENTALTFSDNGEIAEWAVEAIAYCVENGLMSGMGDNIFDPAGTASRAMGATVLARMHGKAV